MLTHSDGFAVKQDDKAIGDRDNGCTALAEFEIELERALADLRLSIGDIVPRRYIKLNSDDDDVDVGVGDPYDRIEDSFSDFTWPVQRALQQLRRALRS